MNDHETSTNVKMEWAGWYERLPPSIQLLLATVGSILVVWSMIRLVLAYRQ